MRVMIVGGGGREHALARAVARSPRVRDVIVTPGNGGICGPKMRAVLPIAVGDSATGSDEARNATLVALARHEGVDLTIVGPEAPLARGLVDDFKAAGLRCFGPSRAATRIESSKAWARQLMARHGIPTPRFATFTDEAAAIEHVEAVEYPVVIKASGLAGGKGVLLPADRDAAVEDVRSMFGGRFGDAGREVVVEELLHGREASLLVFSDGRTAVPMPVVRDHKRLLDGDRGPNTGGMGALAPDPGFPVDLVTAAMDRIINPTLFALREVEGSPYVGVLYAGLMVDPTRTLDDPRAVQVLEFNCRLGDPEAQVVLPLLETDLMDVIDACCEGALGRLDVRWRQRYAASVVAVADGYPGTYTTGQRIDGLDATGQLVDPIPGLEVVHAGTTHGGDGTFVTAGGRVLAVTAIARELSEAVSMAYAGLNQVRFDGMVYRSDIGRDDETQPSVEDLTTAALPADVTDGLPRAPSGSAYAAAGVDIHAGQHAVALMRETVESTHGPEVLSGVGAFAGLFDASRLKELDDPVLVSSTDGCGTKTLVAASLGRYRGLGIDVVNHCINDLVAHGARPLFFMDYVASSRLEPDAVADIVAGAAAACRAVGCALLGGETAEMPGVYAEGGVDVVGTVVGVVSRARIIDGRSIAAGDLVIGLPSAGLHTNGFTLARSALDGLDWEASHPELDASIADTLLVPHRCYLPELDALDAAHVDVRGIVHVTGGGLLDNPARILPHDLAMHVDMPSWIVPPIFELIRRRGQVSRDEMVQVFNLGVGMMLIVPADDVDDALAACDDAWIMGRVEARRSQDRAVVFE